MKNSNPPPPPSKSIPAKITDIGALLPLESISHGNWENSKLCENNLPFGRQPFMSVFQAFQPFNKGNLIEH
jgi:hypothetical protein